MHPSQQRPNAPTPAQKAILDQQREETVNRERKISLSNKEVALFFELVAKASFSGIEARQAADLLDKLQTHLMDDRVITPSMATSTYVEDGDDSGDAAESHREHADDTENAKSTPGADTDEEAA